MAYRLQDNEDLTTGLRRCAREQLQAAVDRLESGVADDPVGAVHDARKALKKERSLLRLARGAMKPGQGVTPNDSSPRAPSPSSSRSNPSRRCSVPM